MGPILDLRAGLNIETTPDATFAWLPDWDSGCAVRCTSAIHVSSDHRSMGSVVSHLRGSSVHSFVYSNIYIYRGSGREASHSHHAPSSSPPAIKSFRAAATFFASASHPLPPLQFLASQPD